MARKPYESEFKVIIPRRKKALNKAVRRMSDRFGGVTVMKVKGAWLNDKGKTVYDNNYLLFSNRDLNGKSPSIMKFDRRFMEELGMELGKDTGEDEIWVEEDIIRDVDFLKIPKKIKLKQVV